MGRAVWGHAAPQVVNGRADRLQASAGRGYQPDRAAAHPIGEPQADAVNDGGAAVRAHHQQSLLAGGLFERDLVLQRDVVAVQEDVFAQLQRLPGHSRRVAPRHGDQYQIGLRERFGRGLQAAGPESLAGGGAAPGRDQVVHLRQRGLRGLFAFGFDHQDEIVGAGLLGFGGQQPAFFEQGFVGGRAHHHAGIFDARKVDERPLELHEDDGVVVRACADFGFRG